MLVLTSIAVFLSTMAGGLFAIRHKDKLHLILGFSAGAVIALAFFDLLPEALELSTGYDISFVTTLVAIGFVIFMLIDRFFSIHSHDEDDCHNKKHIGRIGAGSLSFHSFLDGLAIGIGFQVSVSIGLAVTVAVLVHDFSDGINTAGFILKHGGTRKEALKWLVLDSIAPILGIFIGSFTSFSESSLGLILAVFTGFFLYIGASDLLPESHHSHPTYWTTFMTVIGMVVMYLAIKIAGV